MVRLARLDAPVASAGLIPAPAIPPERYVVVGGVIFAAADCLDASGGDEIEARMLGSSQMNCGDGEGTAERLRHSQIRHSRNSSHIFDAHEI